MISKIRARLSRRNPAGDPEADLVKASGRNSAKVLDRIGRLLVLLLHYRVPLMRILTEQSLEGLVSARQRKGEALSEPNNSNSNNRCFKNI